MFGRWLLLVTLVPVIAACTSFAAPLPSLDGTEPAPNLSLPTPDGQQLRLSDFRGQVVFVNFWGTYCPPCVAEMPDLQRTYEALADEPFVILGVNAEEKPDKVKTFLLQQGITFPIVISEDATVNPVMALKHMPTTWFVDANGILRGRIEGQMDAGMAMRIARTLLAEIPTQQ